MLSADGKVLAISARARPAPRRSSASDHRRRTHPRHAGEPSYLHGITPDGTQLAYCASRNGNYDIYVIPITGGEEKRLTVEPGLDDESGVLARRPDHLVQLRQDGPDAGMADERGRHRADADDLRRGELLVPHVSRDGKRVVMIVYAKGDVEPGSHPANKNVELRLMPAAGGKPETIVRLFGGQGTLNVNSWAPDNRAICVRQLRTGEVTADHARRAVPVRLRRRRSASLT